MNRDKFGNVTGARDALKANQEYPVDFGKSVANITARPMASHIWHDFFDELHEGVGKTTIHDMARRSGARTHTCITLRTRNPHHPRCWYSHHQQREILHLFFPVGQQPLKPLKDFYKDSYKLTIFFIENDQMTWYWNCEDMERLRKSFINKVNKNKNYLNNFYKEWKKRIKTFDKIMLKIDHTDLTKLSNENLLKLYNKWYKAYLQEYGIAIGIQDAFSMHAEYFLLPHFEKICKKKKLQYKTNEYFSLLMSPVDDSFFTLEYKDRLKILKWMKNKSLNDKQTAKKLTEHAKNYHWISNNYAKEMNLNAAYFKGKLRQIKDVDPDKELNKLKKEMQDIKKNKANLIQQLKLDAKSKNLIKIAEVFTAQQDERKKYVLIATHYQYLFMVELQKRLKLKKEQIEYTFIHELEELFNQKVINKKIFEERKKACCVIQTLKGYEIYSGQTAEKIHKDVFLKKHEDTTSFKGMIASRGKAKGIVKVLKTVHDLINVQEGDIIVSSMTRPEMMVAIEKAAAIITDEGGITSHAAIVSRELKIPCIIGTKIATKVLKDGDQVEVDANTGIIKKI